MKKLIQLNHKIKIISNSLLFLLLGLSFFNPLDSFSEEPDLCEWQISNQSLSNNYEVSSHENLFELNSNSSEQNSILLECYFIESTDITNSLFRLQLNLNSIDETDLIFSIIDINGNKNNAPPIMEWYDISLNKQAFVSLDPIDFKNGKPNLFNYQNARALTLEISSPSIYELTLSNPSLTPIASFDKYSIFENLPVQSTLPSFFALIFFSFPLGYVLLDYVKFFKNESFFLKIPWMMGLGFIIFILFSFSTSILWISFESILAFAIISVSVFLFYLKSKIKFEKIEIPKLKRSSILFLSFLIFSGVFSILLAENSGWPVDNEDSRQHVAFTILTMAQNRLTEGTSYIPISDIAFNYKWYPKASHVAVAGISFFTDTFPPTAWIATMSFMLFLIPPMLSSLVYKYTRSLFFSLLMFMFSFWRPSYEFWYGDIIWNKWVGGIFAGEIGIFHILIIIMLLITIYETTLKRKTIFLLILASFSSLLLSYYAVAAMPIFIGIIALLIFTIKNKIRATLLLSGLFTVFITIPIWSTYVLKGTLLEGITVTSHFKYIAHFPFDFNDFLFPFWISSALSLIFSCILIRDKRYRILSLSYIIISIIQLLTISKDILLTYFFYIQNTRTLGLMFYLSIIINLIFISFVISKYNEKTIKRTFSAKKIQILKFVSIFFISLLLIPSFIGGLALIIGDNYWFVNKAPGGNERNIVYWLYDNTNSNELVLNDNSHAASWLYGFRGQNSTNSWWQSMVVSRGYNYDLDEFLPLENSAKNTVLANEILKNPWDYDYINEKLKEIGIKYVYISERENIHAKCMSGRPDSCYLNSTSWAWHNFSGNSRVDMYENHPNLELIIRNGNSALFRVI